MKNQGEVPSSAAESHQVCRERLLHLLAEPAELEHNILCSYLYAAFSLKQGEDEGLTSLELETVARWREGLMGLCVEEMVHLAQVSNLLVALGSRPHFNRPNLPVAPGYHPAGVTVTLAPFSLETLEHFIFLERPDQAPITEPSAFQCEEGTERPAPAFRPLMPRGPAYKTIGEFYLVLRGDLELAAMEQGECLLFSGPSDRQLSGQEMHTRDLVVVRGLDDARRAVDLIVEQGEGSGHDREDSHFGRFESMRKELLALKAARPEFEPARAVAREPVMHAPVEEDRVWVRGARAAPVLDAANAAYSAMLRCLVQLYDTPGLHSERRQALLGAALSCMKTVTVLGSKLTRLPATDESSSPRAGMSFAMLRAIEGPIPELALPMLAERLHDIGARLAWLDRRDTALEKCRLALVGAADAMHKAKH